MSKKKEIIMIIIILGGLAGTLLPKPYSTIISLVLLIPCIIYLLADIFKNGNRWED